MTPAYNRAYIIDKLYQSLKKQTDFDFEWLVIDDGSTDNTEEYFSEVLKQNNPFEVRYIKKQNGGKHTCINMATDIAEGEYFFIVDSDDFLPENSVERIKFWIDSIEKTGDEKLVGVCGQRFNYNENCAIGYTFDEKKEYLDITLLQREDFAIYGDKAEVLKTEILKKYKFPEFENERFVTEIVVWYDIAKDGYKFRFFNEPVYMCEYLEDGLTKNLSDITLKSPKGYIFWQYKKIYWYDYNFKKRLGVCAFSIKFLRENHLDCKENIKWLKKLFKINGFTLKLIEITYNLKHLLSKLRRKNEKQC